MMTRKTRQAIQAFIEGALNEKRVAFGSDADGRMIIFPADIAIIVSHRLSNSGFRVKTPVAEPPTA